MNELLFTLKGNWLVVLIAIIVFSFIVVIYPYTDMGKQEQREAFQHDMSRAIILERQGKLDPELKIELMEKYGITEEAFDPLRNYLEKNN